MFVEDSEVLLALLSLLRLLYQWHQLGLFIATQSTTPSMKIGMRMIPQSSAYGEGLESMTSGISSILHVYTVLANAMQGACVRM